MVGGQEYGLSRRLTCCRQLGQRCLSIVIGQQQQQYFNYYNDKTALIVKQKHCNPGDDALRISTVFQDAASSFIIIFIFILL